MDSGSLADFERVRARFDALLLPFARQEVSVGSLPRHAVQNRSQRISKLKANSLRSNPSFTPRLERVLSSVSKNLHLRRDSFEVFVFPDAQINGFCVLGTFPLSVGVSSMAVNTLDDAELAFVIGHEIGHGVFESATINISDEVSFENALLSRSLELTMDRVGILSSNDADASMRTMLKLVSGLSESQLRFDFSSYSHEARSIQFDLGESYDLLSSHPPLVIRYRAALSFLASDAYGKLSRGTSDVREQDLALANRFISAALSRVADGKAISLIEAAVGEMVTWFAVFMVRNGLQISLSKITEISGIRLSRDDVAKGLDFASSYDESESRIVIIEKLNESIGRALSHAPRRVNRFVEALRSLLPPDVSVLPLELYAKFFSGMSAGWQSPQ